MPRADRFRLPLSARRPPSPRGLPLLGGSIDYTRDSVEYLRRAHRECGDIAYLRLFGKGAYFVNHPDLIERVMVTDNRKYQKDFFIRRLRDVLGEGLSLSEGGFWQRQRRLMQPAFHGGRIALYASMMVEETEKMLATYRIGEVRDIHVDMMALTLRIVCRTLLGSSPHIDTKRTGEALEILAERFSNSASGIAFLVFPKLGALPLPVSIRFRHAVGALDEIIYRIIEERKTSGARDDLLSMLIDARGEDGNSMTDRQLRDEAMAVFLGGHETSALALTYTFLCLSRHPEAAERLHAEISAVLGERAATAADVPALRFTECTVLESLRLYPPFWVLAREVCDEAELGGYVLPKRAQVWMSPWLMHRDPRFFADPESFSPKRWEHELLRELPKFAYFPFGGGSRACIGQPFAMMEASLVLASIARKYRLSVLPGSPEGFIQSMTLRPKGPVLARVETW
jgi:cytochrome P450